jgi:serine/threonine protein kinase
MGAPISDHRGRRCCPALQKETEKKYFVKVISVPASQVQLDALLLSGAYPSTEAALNYFQELSNEITAEAALLQKLSRLEGFQSYEAWQIEPMEDGTGFDVYLLGEYVMTLERRTRAGGLTHLNAVNLGLDLCAALSVCRRNGFLYVDLKPENIVISENRGYQIGDIGFIRLSSLKYASLPEQYHSAYTAPEITDAFSALNTTIDTYAVGMILYQVFNDGRLPENSTELTAPAYADPEMAQIILKACAADPADRWQDPLEMGQALVSYMQRNTVNDTPIVPLPEPEEPEVPEEPAEVIEEVPEPEIVEELPAEPEPAPNRLKVQCFGSFEVFWQGEPLKFARRQTKELLAYLVDRRGAFCAMEDVISALWGDVDDMKNAKHRVRNYISDLRETLKEIDMEDVLIRRTNNIAIRTELLDCDYYRMLEGDMAAVNAFRGEYMTNYSWAELTAGNLYFNTF